jgi:SMODS-associated and fused to various effectors sensor domain
MIEDSNEKSRAIPPKTSLFLYTKAGGRCEFDKCNRYLLEHHLTGTEGNFAEKAHIWAFQENGPRGKILGRPKNINNISNLILLCAECHHLIDVVEPKKYTVTILKEYKAKHEKRIFHLTSLSKSESAIPLMLRGRIDNKIIDISDAEMQEASVFCHLDFRNKIDIDLTSISDEAEVSFWDICKKMIDREVERLYQIKPSAESKLRISIFALAPIPLLIYLGSKLSDKMEVDLYQRHRFPESWNWKDNLDKNVYSHKCLVKGEKLKSVILLINLCGENKYDDIPNNLVKGNTIYEITIDNKLRTPLCLDTLDDLDNFKVKYIETISIIRQNHPSLETIHLFPAVPAPVAVIIGRSRLSKVDPAIEVYDRDKRVGIFVKTLEIK